MKSNTCRVCKEGTLLESTVVRTYHPNSQTVEVQLLESRCEKCGTASVSGAQHSENLRRLAARKASYGDQLMGEEYIALRKRYGLTQRQASKIFGKGLIAFSRYENEESYPDASTRLLIELAIARPDILKILADKACVEIPLWKEREEDRLEAEAKQEEARMQAEAKLEQARMQAEAKLVEARMQVEAERVKNTVRPEAKSVKPRLTGFEPVDTKANAETDNIWFALLPVEGSPYEYVYGNSKQRSVIRKSYSIGCVSPVFDIGWLDGAKGLSISNRACDVHVEAQRYVFSDAPVSSPDADATGETMAQNAAIGGRAA